MSEARKKLRVASPYIAIIWNIFEKFLPNTIFGSFLRKDNKPIINIGLFLPKILISIDNKPIINIGLFIPKIIIKQIIFRIISVFALEFFPNALKLI